MTKSLLARIKRIEAGCAVRHDKVLLLFEGETGLCTADGRPCAPEIRAQYGAVIIIDV